MNYVNVTCDQNDTVKSANASVYVYETDMKINKTANVSDVYVGDLVNFTISVKNQIYHLNLYFISVNIYYH